MAKKAPDNKKLLKVLNTQIKKLQAELETAQKLEGKDTYISVAVKKNQARFERVKKKGVEDKAVGKFYLEIIITAKQFEVYVPISIASGKKVAGFMYQIEGEAEGSLMTADVKLKGKGVSQVTLGTLQYAKIPAGLAATFEIRASIVGAFGKAYKLVFTRLNYKRHLTEVRYQQYLKEISSEKVTFS